MVLKFNIDFSVLLHDFEILWVPVDYMIIYVLGLCDRFPVEFGPGIAVFECFPALAISRYSGEISREFGLSSRISLRSSRALTPCCEGAIGTRETRELCRKEAIDFREMQWSYRRVLSRKLVVLVWPVAKRSEVSPRYFCKMTSSAGAPVAKDGAFPIGIHDFL